jgi:hypothetical protein
LNLLTKIEIPKASSKIDYSKKLAFFGSCFADNISRLFANRKFQVLANPFGTVYNPLSLSDFFKNIQTRISFNHTHVFQDLKDNSWHSFYAHSILSAKTEKECMDNLNLAAVKTLNFLENADFIFITLGTAFVYCLKSSNSPVFNCHKQNPELFSRELISVEQATNALENIVRYLIQIKQNKERLNIVFTVSPLRHLADGFHENTLSKSTLHLAIQKVILNFSDKNVSLEYFPSYEIVMDELRDYRFYDSDMIHLSETAEEYIFEKMITTYCSEDFQNSIAEVEKFLKSAQHNIKDIHSLSTKKICHHELTKSKRIRSKNQ